MKVDFNVQLNDARGKGAIDGQGKSIIIADLLIDQLAGKPEGITPRKAMGYVKKLVDGEPLELDDADFRALYTYIENHKDFFAFVVMQILDVMDASKENKKIELVK